MLILLLAEQSVGDIDDARHSVMIRLFGWLLADNVHVQLVGMFKERIDGRVLGVETNLAAAFKDKQVDIVARCGIMLSLQMVQSALHHLQGTGKVEIADIGTYQIAGRFGIRGQVFLVGRVFCSIERCLPVEFSRTSLHHAVVGIPLPVVTLALTQQMSLFHAVGQRQHLFEVFLLRGFVEHADGLVRSSLLVATRTAYEQQHHGQD